MSTEIEQIGSRNKPEEMKQTILENLYYLQAKSTELATMNDWYIAVAYTVRNRMMKNWVRILERLHGMQQVCTRWEVLWAIAGKNGTEDFAMMCAVL